MDIFKAIYKKTNFTHIFGLLLIILYRKVTFFSKKQLYIFKIFIEIFIFTIVLAFLLYITRLIRLNYNRNR